MADMTDITLEQRAPRLATQEMIDAGTVALLAFRKSGGDWTEHPTHAAEVAIEAALRLSAGADWQPIETAPKDGRTFIGYNPVTGPHEAYWSEDNDSWVMRSLDSRMAGPWYPALTHWQALPAAPRHEPGEG